MCIFFSLKKLYIYIYIYWKKSRNWRFLAVICTWIIPYISASCNYKPRAVILLLWRLQMFSQRQKQDIASVTRMITSLPSSAHKNIIPNVTEDICIIPTNIFHIIFIYAYLYQYYLTHYCKNITYDSNQKINIPHAMLPNKLQHQKSAPLLVPLKNHRVHTLKVLQH